MNTAVAKRDWLLDDSAVVRPLGRRGNARAERMLAAVGGVALEPDELADGDDGAFHGVLFDRKLETRLVRGHSEGTKSGPEPTDKPAATGSKAEPQDANRERNKREYPAILSLSVGLSIIILPLGVAIAGYGVLAGQSFVAGAAVGMIAFAMTLLSILLNKAKRFSGSDR